MTTTLRLSRSAVRVAGWVVTAGALASGVAACSSGGSTSTTTAAAPTGQPAASGTADGQGGGFQGGGRQRFDPAQLQKIRDCLSAAGITLPSGRPSGFPSGRPSDFPTDGSRPSGFPSGRPSGGFGGGLGGVLNSPQAKAALEACGIAVPTFSPRPRGSAPAASPTAG